MHQLVNSGPMPIIDSKMGRRRDAEASAGGNNLVG
jgi:hypothetical protein